MDSVSSCNMSSSSWTSTSGRRRTIPAKSSKSVSFGTTQSLVFEVIQGHPDFDAKSPLSLGWTCLSTSEAIPVDQYENDRAPPVSDLEELLTSKKERKQMIKNCQKLHGKQDLAQSSVWRMLRRPTKVLFGSPRRIQAC
ncbi:expressed unknown protein [Seminavis robusta]|uniref:Uncharacterized protein n=1 Tax=Seminavis robusta TaxID=568900 RepID=A0A9N8EPR7_9STRA|nr:expressed unknown protein [Seminavis robusta]|eukprot:Sro1617_g286351.1  (139) ;mRNA; r:24327-24743